MGQVVPFEAFPFVGPSNLSISPYIDAERSINLYYEPSYLGGRAALVGTPGVSAPVATLPAVGSGFNVRGLFAGNGRLFAVGGSHFYEVTPAIGGGIVTDFGAMAGDNGLSVRSQCQILGGTASPMVLICNPYSTQLYFVGVATLTSVFNAYAMEYLDGFFLAIATGASLDGTNPNQINCSTFNDGTSWPGTQFVIQEGTADAINMLATVNNLLWVFGQKNITIYYNAGLPNFPFARVNGGTINVGCIAPQTVVKIANTVMWLGGSERGHGQVYIANGFQPQKVSTPAIEYLIGQATQPSATNLGKFNAYAYAENGHEFYCLNIESQPTLCYDVTTKVWHERIVGNGVLGPALPFCAASVEQSPSPSFVRTFAGDRTSGNIYILGQEYTNENGAAIYRQRTATHASDSLKWTKYPSLEVFADIGTAQMSLIYSKDGGKTFPTLNRPDRTISGSNDQGGPTNIPTYKRFKWNQLGRARIFTPGITIYDANNPIVIARGVLTAGAGSEYKAAA